MIRNWLASRLSIALGILLISLAAPVARSARAQGFGGEEGELTVTAEVLPAEGKQPAKLSITAEIPPGWHIYSLTQKAGGPVTSKIKLPESKQYKLLGDFSADPPPKVHTAPDLYGDLKLEEHEGSVTWQAPIELAAGVDPGTLEIKGSVYAQRCEGADKCLPPKSFPFVATGKAAASGTGAQRAPSPQPSPIRGEGAAAPFQPENSHLQLTGSISPAVAAPGSLVSLSITATPLDKYHVYALAERDAHEVGLGKPTLIELSNTSQLRYTRPAASGARLIEEPVSGGGTLRYYDEPVTWTVTVDVPATAKAGDYPISGLIGIQSCGVNCDLPDGVGFSGTIKVGAEFSGTIKIGQVAAPGTTPLEFRPTKYGKVAELADMRTKSTGGGDLAAKPQASSQPLPPSDSSAKSTAAGEGDADTVQSLAVAVLFSLLGGAILNLMPCVLPVIGLKLFSFLEQGGKSRAHVFALNLAYTLGLLSVFMVLATLAAFAGFAWGERSTAFNIGLTCVVFAMALSFLGVWEIPIPGFVGSGKGVEIAAREGMSGAFAKGVLTTILATPCSGPFLGSVFAYVVKQPPGVAYLIFGCIGIGMASPYLIIGAFPALIRGLPKPGAWMDTFKQVMGFVLLGTVVFLFSTLSTKYLVPTFTLLIGLWAGCWWIGRTPLFAPIGQKLRAWAIGSVVAAAVGLFAFLILVPGPSVLDWEPYSATRLQDLTHQGKTVLVDFTAEWCFTCKYNLRFAINTEDVRDVVKANGVTPMVADYTDYGDDIKHALNSIAHSASIPVMVIFPGKHPDQPIILRDTLTKQKVVEALEQAGPSLRDAKPTATAASDNAGDAAGVAAMK